MPGFDGRGSLGNGFAGAGRGSCGGGTRRGVGRSFGRGCSAGQGGRFRGLDDSNNLSQEVASLRGELESMESRLNGLQNGR